MIDFFNLKRLLGEAVPGVFTKDSWIYYPNHCKDIDLPDLGISVNNVKFNIPQKFWTKDVVNVRDHPTCQILIKINSHYQVGNILGQPFLKAFTIVFDFEDNRIGFGNKVNFKDTGA